MAQFYGTIQGARGEASRLGNKQSGISVSVKSWEGEVNVRMYHLHGVDHVFVSLGAHNGGQSTTLYAGPCNGWAKRPVAADVLASAVWDMAHGREPKATMRTIMRDLVDDA